MSTGKLPNQILEGMLKKHVQNHREEVIMGAGIGWDTAKVDLGGKVAVLSTDPITGAKKGIGRLAVQVSVNDVVCSSADPIGILVTILAPEGSTYEEIGEVIHDAAQAAGELNMEIIGGHTEITNAVNQMVVSTTVLGGIEKDRIQDLKKVKKGDLLYVTKAVGLEGTGILCQDQEDFLKTILSPEELEEGKSYLQEVSVLQEGILGHDLELLYMHDATEGGILGACYEAYKGLEMGLEIDESRIPLRSITKKVCEAFQIHPFHLISSGSLLLIVEKDEKEKVEAAYQEKNIPLTCIGKVTQEGIRMKKKDGNLENIDPPTVDHLYIALGRKFA